MKRFGRTIDERARAAREQVFSRYIPCSGRQM